MKKIAFICPYFGTLPKHTQLWLNSCAANEDIDWYLFTDDHTAYHYPQNVIVKYTTLVDMKNRFQQYFDFSISLKGVYKLGDYKPLYGYLFEKELKGYDAWGHIDVPDEIYGDIRKFVTDDLLDEYDKLMIFGHMCIYKNTPEVNERFKQPSDIQRSYKLIFSSDKFYNFEEIAKGSITRIYMQNGWRIGRLDEHIADISGISYAFKLGRWSDDCNHLQYLPRVPLIFSWESGKVFGYSVENGQLIKKEYLYVHFKRRKMDVRISEDADKYLIVPDCFVAFPVDLSAKIVKKYSKNKLFYKVYFIEKRKALMVRLKQVKEKLTGGGIELLKKLLLSLPDKQFLKLKYFYVFKKPLNLREPKTFNEKIQWLKLYNRKDEYTRLVDKGEVKKYVASKIGAEHIIPTIGVYDSFSDIDFSVLPKSFVIKCTHDSGGLVICKDKDFLDIDIAKEKIEKCLHTDFYLLGREWPYKNVKHRIIAEEYIEEKNDSEIKDYKVFCFNGMPKLIQLDYDRFTQHHRNMYDTNWNLLQMGYTYPADKSRIFERPVRLDEMLSLARILSENIPFVRCDFYIVNDKVLFGEMTFFPESGYGKFIPNEWDMKLGQWLCLDND